MSPKEIEVLIEQTANGSQEAFGALYDATSAKLFAVVLRVLKDKSAAEDALQDVYVKVWKNADKYSRTGHSPMTWLITIARNTAIDRLRAVKPETDIANFEEVLPSSGPSPEVSAIAASEARRIAACMEELGADRRNAVRGAYIRGQSYDELAKQYGVPINTMRTWLRRSLIALRECVSR